MKKDGFILLSLKVLNTGIFAKYQEDGKTAILSYDDNKRAGHPDLATALEGMQKHYDIIFNTTDRGTDVKGINFKGENLQITGMFEAQNGALCSLNTPFFSITDNEFGLSEKDFLQDINILKTEIFMYLFKNKAAQQQIAFKEEPVKADKE